MQEETWLPVAGFEGRYSVSDLGRVRSEERMARCGYQSKGLRRIGCRILSACLQVTGYPGVRLSVDGAPTTRTVHSLVAEAFIGPRPDGMEVAHEDGDRTNPVLSNQRYDTRKGNMADQLAHGTSRKGRAQGRLTAALVRKIPASDKPASFWASRAGVSKGAIRYARRSATWSHLPPAVPRQPQARPTKPECIPPRGAQANGSKLTEQQARALLALPKGGKGLRKGDIARFAAECGISKQAADALRSGRTWAHLQGAAA